MNNEHELMRGEFDWFAVDHDGRVGLFATGGEGFIPHIVLDNFKENDTVADSMDDPRWGSPDVWSDYSKIGLYVYDWDCKNGLYNRVRTPAVEIGSELRDRILSLNSLVKFAFAFEISPNVEKRQITGR